MSKQEMSVFVNGEFYPESQAKISVYDHGFLYGDGVFEGIRAYGGRVFRLVDHIDRLFESAKTVGIAIPLSKRDVSEACAETLRRNNLSEGYLRLVVSRGSGKMGLDPRNCEKATLVIIPATYVIALAGLKPIKAVVVSMRRNPPFCVPASAKTLNYLNNILARIEAINAGADEAILLDLRGFVCEGSGDNVFIVKNGKLLTPPLEASILGGVTRTVVIEVAKRLGIEVLEKDLTTHDLYNADEAFLTGTGAEVHPIAEIDGRKIGMGEAGPITVRLEEGFKKETQRPENGYQIWK
jgi:branched-chain amino acid aminotransferase